MADGDTDRRGADRGGADPGDGDPQIIERHLTRAWQAWTPDPGLYERVRARLATSNAFAPAAVVLGAALRPSKPSFLDSLRATGKGGLLVGAGLLGLGFVSGYFSRTQPIEAPRAAAASTPSAPVAIETASPSAATATLRADTPTPALERVEAAPEDGRPERRQRAAPAPRRSPRPASAADKTLAAATPEPPEPLELELLRRAERAVRAENAALALALIGEVEERFPRSRFVEERRAIELLAQCQEGASDSKQRAADFLGEHPKSLYAARIRTTCTSEANDTTLDLP